MDRAFWEFSEPPPVFLIDRLTSCRPGRMSGAPRQAPATRANTMSPAGRAIGPNPTCRALTPSRTRAKMTTVMIRSTNVSGSPAKTAKANATAKNATWRMRWRPRTMSTTAARSHPVQATTEAMGQPSQTKNGPLNSNTVPARAQAKMESRRTLPRTYAPVPAMNKVVNTCTVNIKRRGKR